MISPRIPELIALKLANRVSGTDFGPIKKEMDAAIKSLGGTDAASDFVRTQAITYLHAKRQMSEMTP